MASDFVKLRAEHAFLDYDREVDVLYVSFQKPRNATNSEMLENGMIVHYRGDEVVGVTILDASKRAKQA